MATIKIKDLPELSDMTPEQLKELFGAGFVKPSFESLEERVVMDVGGLSELGLTAQAAIVTDFNGNVLGDLEPDETWAMASTTKIMTTMLAIEMTAPGNEWGLSLQDEVEIGAFPANMQNPLFSGVGNLVEGQKFKLEDLLYVVMKPSDNAATQAVAEHLISHTTNVGGIDVPTEVFDELANTFDELITGTSNPVLPPSSIAMNYAFANRMNARAAELGMTNSSFMNPFGGDHPGHFSTARDMATLARAAMRIDKFRQIVGQSGDITIPFTLPDGSTDEYELGGSSSGLLGKYPGAEGLKTGWNVGARGALVSQATILGRTVDGVVLQVDTGVSLLNEANVADIAQAKKDTYKILSYGFEVAHGFTVGKDLNGTGELSKEERMYVTTATGEYKFADKVADRTFTIGATSGDDTITIERNGADVVITVNGVPEWLPAADLPSIDIDSDGHDTITITGNSSNLPINIKNAANHGLIFDSGTALQNVNLDGGASITLFGTAGDDVIEIRRYANDMDIKINGVSEWLPISDLSEIKLYALGGSDTITIHSVAVNLPIIIYAGSGSDTVKFHTGVGLDILDSTIHVNGGSGSDDVVEFNDAGTIGGRTWTVNNEMVSRNEMSNVFYQNIDRLKIRGSNYADTFNVTTTAAGTDVEIDGAYGSDELVAPNMINNWMITGKNSGNLDDFLSSTGEVDFTSVENLTGGTTYDYFKFLGGSVSGNIDGAGGTYDVLSYKDVAPGVTVNLQTSEADLIEGVFDNIEQFWGSDKPAFSLPGAGGIGAGAVGGKKSVPSKDTLVGKDLDNTWSITDDNEGSVAGDAGTWKFKYFENLIGGGGSDTFRLSDGKGVSGKLDGKGGADTLDYTDYTSAVSVNLAAKQATNVGAGVHNIEQVIDADPSGLQAVFGFYSTGNFAQNWGGLQEKWFKGQGDKWYFMTPAGAIHEWDGGVDASPRIARVASSIYSDLSLLFDPDAIAPQKTASELQATHSFYSTGSFSQNWGGWEEKWFKDQAGKWFFITTSGRLYEHAAGADLSGSTMIAQIDANIYTDLSLLFDADAAAPQSTASQLQAAHGFYSTGNFAQNWGGWEEKWFRDQTGKWFFITASGRLYEHASGANLSASTLIAQMDPSVYHDLSLLFDPMFWPHPQAPAALQAELGFYSPGDLLENSGGWEEKWFKDKDNQWYFITASGRLYRWAGGSDLGASTQIALIGPSVYQDLDLLFNA